MKKSLIIALSVFCIGCSIDRKVVKTSCMSSLIDSSGQKIEMAKYTVVNHSKDVLYTWIDCNSLAADSSSFEESRRYFYRPVGDFSLCQLLTDNVVFVDNFTSQINATFLKEIEPGETFSYFLTSERVNDMISHIYCVSGSELSSKYGVHVVNKDVLFKPDFVVITK